MQPVRPPVVLLMGPTGAGKTDCALRLVERFPLQIVSVDSALVYRHLNIGTAKPNAAQLARAPHRLIDIREPTEGYSVAEFQRDALHEIETISSTGNVPLLVGGTGLYFRALESGISNLPPADNNLRKALDQRARDCGGWAAMHAALGSVDPAAAQRIHPNDPQRIQRALEVYELTGRSLSEHWAEGRKVTNQYRWLKIVWAPQDRRALDGRLAQRFSIMMANGLLDECELLRRSFALDREMPSMRTVGYRQMWDHLEGRLSLDAAERAAVKATLQLAKRQYTWFRREQNCIWIDAVAAGSTGLLDQQIGLFLGTD